MLLNSNENILKNKEFQSILKIKNFNRIDVIDNNY